MNRSVCLAAISATLLTVACGTAAAPVQLPDTAPLAMPAAPSHVVVPAAPEPPPAPVVEAPPPVVTPPVTSGVNTRPRSETPPARPTPPVQPSAPPTPAATPTPLEASPNQGVLEQRARELRDAAEHTLERIDARTLSADGRAQYDTAKRFLKQADDALKAKNIVYAWQLADKANTIATLLK